MPKLSDLCNFCSLSYDTSPPPSAPTRSGTLWHSRLSPNVPFSGRPPLSAPHILTTILYYNTPLVSSFHLSLPRSSYFIYLLTFLLSLSGWTHPNPATLQLFLWHLPRDVSLVSHSYGPIGQNKTTGKTSNLFKGRSPTQGRVFPIT